MKTRIAKSSGLALTLIVGIFATLLAMGVLDAKSVWAGPTDNSNLTVAADPNDPGAIAKWTITFDNPSTLAANTGEIIIEFEDDRIERLQDEVADKLGFDLTDHKMVLFGQPKANCTVSGCRRGA